MEYIELGPTPCNEDCVQTGSEDYENRQRVEMHAYRCQLERMFPEANFKIKRFPHDFGSYGEVCVTYIPGTPSEEMAYHVEANLPQNWDQKAKEWFASLLGKKVVALLLIIGLFTSVEIPLQTAGQTSAPTCVEYCEGGTNG